MTSFQLYSARDVEDKNAFLKTLASLGYTQVEGYFGIYDDPVGFRAALESAGLALPSAHIGLEQIDADWENTRAMCEVLGIKHIFAPYLAAEDRPTDAAGWSAFGARLEAVAQKVQAAGLSFGWHNHEFEFETMDGGAYPMALMLDAAPSMSWEGDLAWIARGGADIAEFVANYGNRLTAVHVKDIAPDGENADEDGWADVGHGTLPWAALVTQVRALNPDTIMVMEHDKPSDPVRFATRAIASFEGY